MRRLLFPTVLLILSVTSGAQTPVSRTKPDAKFFAGFSFATFEESASGSRMTGVTIRLDNGASITADEAVIGKDGVVSLLGRVQMKLRDTGGR